MEALGYIQGVHYVVGRKPPKSFAKAIIEPSDYEHVISFYNGSVAVYYKEYISIENLQLLDETEENLLEHRTDGTDAFDTLFIGCEKFPQRNFYPISINGVL